MIPLRPDQERLSRRDRVRRVVETDETAAEPPRRAWLVPVCTSVAFGVLAIRFYAIAFTSFSYDEATYVELARHPWHSSYYPDAFFARHPPLAFLVLGLWTNLFGEAEWVARFPGFILSLLAVAQVGKTARRFESEAWAVTAPLLLASSFIVLSYGVQATLYPLAFYLAARAAEAHLSGDLRREAWALAFLSLTHLFGFVFLALWAWRYRNDLWRYATAFTLPVAWLAASVLLVIALRPPPGPELGPLWQGTRLFEWFYQLYADPTSFVLHVVLVVLLLAALYPILLRDILPQAKRREPVALATVLLLAFFVTGPAFFRFGLVVAPFILALGAKRVSENRRPLAWTGAIAVAALVAGSLFLSVGIDPRAQNDVPGLQDWRRAVLVAESGNATAIGGPAPTAIAYYLEERHGFRLTGSEQGPDLLPMAHLDGRRVEVRMFRGTEDLDLFEGKAAIIAVPSADHATIIAMSEYLPCATVTGLVLLRSPALSSTACPA